MDYLYRLLKVASNPKAIRLLAILLDFRKGLPLSELSKRAGLLPQETHRLLIRLRNQALVSKNKSNYVITLTGCLFLKHIFEMDDMLSKIKEFGDIIPPKIPLESEIIKVPSNEWYIIKDVFEISNRIREIFSVTEFYIISDVFLPNFEETYGVGYVIISSNNIKRAMQLRNLHKLRVKVIQEHPQFELIASEKKGLVFLTNIYDRTISYDKAIYVQGENGCNILRQLFTHFWDNSKEILNI